MAYNKERPLSNWEKTHLFEAFKFGVIKYGSWEFADLKTGDIFEKEKDIDQSGLNKVRYLMSLDKISFNKMIE